MEDFDQTTRLWAPDLPVWEAAWLQEKLQDFDPSETILIGWSLGGMLALEICAAGFKPEALIIIAACASFCRRPDFGLGVRPAVLRGMRQRLRTEPEGVVRDFHRQLLAAGEGEWADKLAELLPHSFKPQWLSEGLEYLQARDLREVLPKVEAESMAIVHGERDKIAPAAQAYFLKEQLPGARLIMLRGTGHVPMLSRSREMNKLIADFL